MSNARYMPENETFVEKQPEPNNQCVLDEKTFANLEKHRSAFHTIKDGLVYEREHVIPLCLGYEKEFPWNEFKAKMTAIVASGDKYTIYTYPKDNQALLDWQENYKKQALQDPESVLNKIDPRFIQPISEWRKTEARKEALHRYEELCKSVQYGKKALLDRQKYVQKFAEEHLILLDQVDVNINWPPQIYSLGKDKQIEVNKIINQVLQALTQDQYDKLMEKFLTFVEARVIDEVVDVISWHQLMFTQNETKQRRPNHFIYCWYDHSLPDPMQNALKNIENMGYFRKSFNRIKASYLDSKKVEKKPQLEENSRVSTRDTLPSPSSSSGSPPAKDTYTEIVKSLLMASNSIDSNDPSSIVDLHTLAELIVLTKHAHDKLHSPPEESHANNNRSKGNSRNVSPPHLANPEAKKGSRSTSPHSHPNGQLDKSQLNKSTHQYLQSKLNSLAQSNNQVEEKENQALSNQANETNSTPALTKSEGAVASFQRAKNATLSTRSPGLFPSSPKNEKEVEADDEKKTLFSLNEIGKTRRISCKG